MGTLGQSGGSLGALAMWAILIRERPKAAPRPAHCALLHTNRPMAVLNSGVDLFDTWLQGGPMPFTRPQCGCGLVCLPVDGPQSAPWPLPPRTQHAWTRGRVCGHPLLHTPRAINFWLLSSHPFPALCDRSLKVFSYSMLYESVSIVTLMVADISWLPLQS